MQTGLWTSTQTTQVLYNTRGWIYIAKGEPDLALADLDKALSLDPELAGASSRTAPALMNSRTSGSRRSPTTAKRCCSRAKIHTTIKLRRKHRSA